MALTEEERRILGNLSVLTPAAFGDFPTTVFSVTGELGSDARRALDQMVANAQLTHDAFSWVSDPLHPIDQVSLVDMLRGVGLDTTLARETPHTLTSSGTKVRYMSGTWVRQWGSADAPHRIIAFAAAGGGDQPGSEDVLATTAQYLEYANRTGPNSGASGNVTGISGAPSCGITLVPVPPGQVSHPEPFMERMVEAIRGGAGSVCTDYAVVSPDEFFVAHARQRLGIEGRDNTGKIKSYGLLDFEAQPWESAALHDLVESARAKTRATSGQSQTVKHVEWQQLPKQLQGGWPSDAQWTPSRLRADKPPARQGYRLGGLMARRVLASPPRLPGGQSSSSRPGF